MLTNNVINFLQPAPKMCPILGHFFANSLALELQSMASHLGLYGCLQEFH